mmetsp:Transcript_31178/g.56959  ORF Transcript_31178/g.56959 Transcript_31178/m.56959 type:complete len:95 (+) Transcript_31178:545-829(+)
MSHQLKKGIKHELVASLSECCQCMNRGTPDIFLGMLQSCKDSSEASFVAATTDPRQGKYPCLAYLCHIVFQQRTEVIYWRCSSLGAHFAQRLHS